MKVLAIIGLIFIFGIAQSVDVENYCEDNRILLGIFPHPEESLCDHYIICALYKTYVITCEPNTIYVHYNETSGTCKPGYIETCELTTTTKSTTTTSTTTTTLPSTTTTTTATSTITTTTTLYPQSTTPVELPSCKGVFMKYLPYPGICYRYVLCLFGETYIGECEENQIFHQVLRYCTRGNRETCRTCLFC